MSRTVVARARGGPGRWLRRHGGGGQRPPPGGGGPGAGGGGPGGPFGGRPGGPAGPLPDLDAAHRPDAGLYPLVPRRRRWPAAARFTGGRGLALIGLAVVALWLASGIYRVQPDEQGVVLRFGAFDRTTLPGLNYHLPWPIETRADAGGHPDQPHRDRLPLRRGATQHRHRQPTAGRNVLEESLMLTGDENIIDIDFAVFWKISDAGRLPVQHPQPGTHRQGGGGKLDARGDRPHADPAGADRTARADRERRAAPDAADPRQLQGRRRDHPGAVAEGRSAGRGGRELPRRAARQHRRRTRCATRPRPIATTSCRAPAATRRASWPRGRARGRPRSPRRPARRSASCRCWRPTSRRRT